MPPEGVTDAAPVLPPLQAIFVWLVDALMLDTISIPAFDVAVPEPLATHLYWYPLIPAVIPVSVSVVVVAPE